MKLTKTIAVRIAALLLLVGLFAAPGFAATRGTIDLPNFACVAPGLYRGAAPTAAGLAQLKALGVTTVIDLRYPAPAGKTERAIVQKLGMRFINLPMGSEPPSNAEVATFLGAASQAGVHPVFVNCQHGADRTGCLFGIYRVTHDGWTYDRAYREMRAFGFKPYYTKLSDAVRSRAGAAGIARP